MKSERRLSLAIGVVALATLVWLLLTMGFVALTLEPEQRRQVAAQLAPRLVLIVLAWLAGLALLTALLRNLFRRFVRAPARLLEQTRVLLAAPQASALRHQGTPETAGLAEAIFALASQRDRLREDVAAQIARASQNVQQEKNRLAALMSELTQSVVVCNLDGRILLYNQRARLQFKALSQAPELAGGAELMGIGRSIYAVFERQLVAHALESMQQRLARGVANPSAQFVTTTQAGQLLRVQLAPVRNVTEEPSGVNGFVLMLDNVTRAFEEEQTRDQLLHGLTEGSRSALANMQAALDMLAYPELDELMRARFLRVVRDEVAGMSKRVTELAQQAAKSLKTRWPMEEMLGSDVLLAAQRRIEQYSGRSVTLEQTDGTIWLRVDSFSLTQALAYLATRLTNEFDPQWFRLRLQSQAERAQLDLIWNAPALRSETLMGWEFDAIRFGAESTALTVRDVVERHGGEMWFELDRARGEGFFRFLLPLAAAQEQLEVRQILHQPSRPEFYDFDLFQHTEHSSAFEERLLSDLTFTVFDTETTGLNPSAGDQIIQLGAVRCVNGKLLKQESFEQLVNPGRSIPEAGIPIHGITQDMVQGKPAIAAVLPAFYAFAKDTVLVAHNAAFDMKFLQLQEAASGLVFDQPVLDTLLLSAVVHPNQESHRLEAIAERFNITVLGRHTALGDAFVTAEVWLRLIVLLQTMGIQTLGQAREAAQKTYYARLKY